MTTIKQYYDMGYKEGLRAFKSIDKISKNIINYIGDEGNNGIAEDFIIANVKGDADVIIDHLEQLFNGNVIENKKNKWYLTDIGEDYYDSYQEKKGSYWAGGQRRSNNGGSAQDYWNS